MEIWGGNRRAARSVEMPGLAAWVAAAPSELSDRGGDVHFLSVCTEGLIARAALADVSGHGPAVEEAAGALHELMHRYVNTWDHAEFMRDLDSAFRKNRAEGRALYATAVLVSYFRSRIALTLAGHPPPLRYASREGRWEFVSDAPEELDEPGRKPVGLPIGVARGSQYGQAVLPVRGGDLLVLYSDGLLESRDRAGRQLGEQGLLELARSAPVSSPAAAGEALIAGVRDFRDGAAGHDDETVIALQKIED